VAVRNNKFALSEVVRRQDAGPHTQRPCLPGETRFNSHESMLASVDSLLSIYREISNANSGMRTCLSRRSDVRFKSVNAGDLPQNLLPDEHEVARMQYYRRLLKMFVQATKLLEGDGVTSVLVPKTMYGLWRDVNDVALDRNVPALVQEYAAALAASLTTRVGHDWLRVSVYTCAAMFDPNQPDAALSFLADGVINDSITMIVDESFMLDPVAPNDAYSSRISARSQSVDSTTRHDAGG
jgi:hypothetical protein